MKKRALITAIICAGAAVGLISFFAVRSVHLRGQTSAFHPFTATMVDYHYSSSNQSQPAFSEFSTIAVRSDGSTVRIHRRGFPGDHKWYNMRVIFNPTAGTRVAVDPITHSTTTYHLKPEVVQLRLSWEQACAAAAQAGASTILGYQAVRVDSSAYVTHNNIPAARETWEAPSLDCLALKDLWRAVDPMTKSTFKSREIDAVSIIEGNPDASLFQIPPDYQERSPSQVLALQASLRMKPYHAPTGAVLDRAYALAH